MFTIHDIMNLAIQIEKNGEAVYRKAAEEADTKHLQESFFWLADQELEHRGSFQALKQRQPVRGDALLSEEMGGTILQKVLGAQTFSLEDEQFFSGLTMAALIERAREFENDTILFYELIMGVIDDSGTIKILEHIIGEEHRHVERLEELLTLP